MEERRSKPKEEKRSVQSVNMSNSNHSSRSVDDSASLVEFKLDSLDETYDVQWSPNPPKSNSAAPSGNSLDVELEHRHRSEMKADLFIMANAKYFDSHQLPMLRNHLIQLDDSRWSMIQLLSFINPLSIQLVSFFVGSWGVDRFLIGDNRFGLIKLLTFGGLGFLTIYDWFMIQRATREKNLQKLGQYFR